MTYLRITKADYETIRRACRSLDLTEDLFSVFKYFLVESLLDGSPELAHHVAQLRREQLRLLFEHLRQQKQPVDPAPADDDLSPEELRQVADACRVFIFQRRFLRPFRNFLLRRFGRTAPGLKEKLARLDEAQLERLFDQVARRQQEGA